MVFEALETPHLEVIFSVHFQPSTHKKSADLELQKKDLHEVLGQPYFPFPRASFEKCFQPSPLTLVASFDRDLEQQKGRTLAGFWRPPLPSIRAHFQLSIQGTNWSNFFHLFFIFLIILSSLLGGLLQKLFNPLILDMGPSSCAKSHSKTCLQTLEGKS